MSTLHKVTQITNDVGLVFRFW